MMRKNSTLLRILKVSVLTALCTSCMACAMDDSSLGFDDIVKLREYDYKTDEKASLNLFNMKDYKFDVSDEKVYAKRTFHFGGDNIDLSKTLRQGETQQTATFTSSSQEVMLTSF